MSRFSLVSLFIALAVPAFAKPFPLPCNDVWAAVKDTLQNTDNYRIVAMNSDQLRASFIVYGALYPGVHAVFLKPRGNGCDMEVKMGFTGNDDEGALRNRVNHALAKRRAAKPPAPPGPTTGASE
jgi:hypothetical protein